MADFTDADVEKFLQSRGIKTQSAPAPAPTPEGGGAPSAGPPSAQAAPVEGAKSKEDKLKEIYEGDWQARASRGVAKGVARFGSNVGQLATGLFPSLGELAGRLPESVQRKMSEIREFGEEPSEDWAQWLGSGAGEVAPNLMLPGAGATKVAGGIASRLPATFARGGGFVPSRAANIVTGTGKAVDTIAKGAQAGAIANPDDPSTGAVVGGVAGAIPGVAGPALRTEPMKWIGGHMLPSAISGTLGMVAGIPPWISYPVAHSIRWHSSPIGRRLIRAGRFITDQSGRVIGEYVPGGAAGAAAGQAMQ